MSNTIPILPYSKKDPQDVLAAIKNMLPGLTQGQWTDFLDSDIGYALIKTFVAILDRHLYWTDQQISECFLSLCRTREAAIRIAQQLNYPIATATPATVEVLLTFPAFNAQVEIAANSQWLINKLPFVCQSPIVISANQTSVQVSMKQGTPYTLNKTANGLAWMNVTVPRNICELVVKVNNEVFERIDSFIGVTNEKSFKFGEKIDGQILTFGANIGTVQPAQGDAIVITGILTEGIAGNLPTADYPVLPVSTILNSLNQDVTNSFSGKTITAALGGNDVETIESIKAHAPAFYTTQGRCVTKSDYEAVVATVPGITEVKVISGEDINRYGEVHIIAYADDPYTVSDDFKTLILNTIKPKSMIATTLVISSPVVEEVALTLDVAVDSSIITDLSTARNLTDNAIFDLFNSLKIEKNVYESDILTAVKTIPGVVWVKCSSAITSFATSTAGKIKIPVISNADLSSCILKKLDGTILFQGTGTLLNIDGFFNYTSTGLTDQKCTLQYVANSDDIILNTQQVLVLTSLAINASYAS